MGLPLSSSSSSPEFALLFDCDGVILETEELHRLAYNEAFQKFDLTIGGEPVVWSVRFVHSLFVLLLVVFPSHYRPVMLNNTMRRWNTTTSCRTL